jgi:hypothetical protein
MDVVGQARAGDQDIGHFLPPGKELHIFLEEVPINALIPYGEEHVADPLSAQVGIRIENPHIVAIPPVTGMAIGKVAQDIVLVLAYLTPFFMPYPRYRQSHASRVVGKTQRKLLIRKSPPIFRTIAFTLKA